MTRDIISPRPGFRHAEGFRITGFLGPRLSDIVESAAFPAPAKHASHHLTGAGWGNRPRQDDGCGAYYDHAQLDGPLSRHVEGISQDRTVVLTSLRPPKNLGEVSMSRRERGTYSCCDLR
jgi:hypothetical protein